MIPLERNPLYALSMEAFNYCLRTSNPRIAIDCGANEGGYTGIMVNEGYKVIAFEPVPYVFAKLVDQFQNNPNVKLCCAGVSDSHYVVQNARILDTWTIGKDGDGGLGPCERFRYKAPFDVYMVSLDSLDWKDGVGIIKLDVDGHEHRAISGAVELLKRCQPCILCEFSGYGQKLGYSAESTVNLIFSLGYHVFSADGKRRFESWESIQPCYPFDTSFDVMLIPHRLSNEVLKHFNQ